MLYSIGLLNPKTLLTSEVLYFVTNSLISKHRKRHLVECLGGLENAPLQSRVTSARNLSIIVMCILKISVIP